MSVPKAGEKQEKTEVKAEAEEVKAGEQPAKTILVSGDVVVDNHVYAGERFTPDASGRGVRAAHVWGGAKLAEGILRAYQDLCTTEAPEVRFGLDLPGRPCQFAEYCGLQTPANAPELHCYANWAPEKTDGKKPVWRVTKAMGYGGDEGIFYDLTPHRQDPKVCPDVVLLDDAALGFRFKLDENPKDGVEHKKRRGANSHFAWPTLLDRKTGKLPEWVILKMSQPLCRGDLWQTLTQRRQRERLVVVVSSGDIRRSSARVSKGLSWERTALDLVRELHQNPALSPLLQCKHLVVPFQSEGALWVSNASSGKPEFHLIIDPRCQEGEWPEEDYAGSTLGFLSCMTASLAANLAAKGASALCKGIEKGLWAMRKLFLAGHGEVDTPAPGFPFGVVAEVFTKDWEKEKRQAKGDKKRPPYQHLLLSPEVALDRAQAERWSILESSEFGGAKEAPPLMGVARRVALFGMDELLFAPHVTYGAFTTADRGEIESLQILRRLIEQYINDPIKPRPLSLAVFGPPGAGKSFAVKQLAKKLIPEKQAKTVTFNLSQFDSQEDLIGAFHQVRDLVLDGKLPVVFWDEFDSEDLYWLKSFLAPMQDGEFTEGQITHNVGACIFVFAGGTRDSMDDFTDRDNNDANRDKNGKTEADIFAEKKGPDFVSRLSGYLNVRGPNPQSEEDICYPVRRATSLRGMLRMERHGRFDIDRDLLSAVLCVKRYRNGSRSLEKLLLYLRDASKGPITRSDLPPMDILGMFVDDTDEFMAYLDQSASFTALAETLAPKIHEAYRAAENKAGRSSTWHLPFSQLPEHIQHDNVAAAERIVDLLALVGLTVAPANATSRGLAVPKDKVEEILARSIETLAQQEHDHWMTAKRQHGYRHGDPRDEATRTHDAMKPYEALSEADKDRDRSNVRNIPGTVESAGHVIVPMTK